eukprot:TRINITY_DN53233_c0_g1_i1.p1 TRINITY_DN53233_c0_g1~~TRINITY_DN53233_c0_g1_i1.p1  ORF type:complete len:207 (+),score=52.64 TRINITY_DN53233_c0_g1_i1:145-765(+)
MAGIGGDEDAIFAGADVPPPLTLRCKTILIGDAAAGKTSLAQVLQGGVTSFPKTYGMTIGHDLAVKKVGIPDTTAVVEMYIIDCGGFPVSQELLRPHWETASVVMLVYDVSNAESFQNLATWYDKVKESRVESAFTGVVIAAKTDLSERPGAVSAEQGQQFSSEKGLEFFETCAAKGHVDAPFNFLAEAFYQKYQDRKADLEANLH